MSGLSRALARLGLAGFALGVAAVAVVVSSDRGPQTAPWISLGWSIIGAGLYAWWRRPENRTGALMAMVGFLWFVGALDGAGDAVPFTFGPVVAAVWIGALEHMLVAFPNGRVTGPLDRMVGAPAGR